MPVRLLLGQNGVSRSADVLLQRIELVQRHGWREGRSIGHYVLFCLRMF